MFPLEDRGVLFQLVRTEKPNLLLQTGQRRLIKSGTMKTGTGSTHFEGEEEGESVVKYMSIIYCPTGEVCLVFKQLKQTIAF